MKRHYDFSNATKPKFAERFKNGAVLRISDSRHKLIVKNRARATTLDFTRDYLIVYLDDARVIQVPLIWFPRLYNATPDQLRNYNWIGRGTGIEWPELDEHLRFTGF